MSNILPHIAYVYDRYNTASPHKEGIVEMRVSYNYKQKYISTGIKLFPKQWKKGRVVNAVDSITLNKTLDNLLSEVRQIVYDMVQEGNVDIFDIPKRLEKLHAGSIRFMEFCEQRAAVRKYGKSEDTKTRYDRFLRLFRKWGGITDFSDITENNIIAYDKYLLSQGMKTNSKWTNYHRFLNSFIIDAIDAGLVNRNPYKWVNIGQDKSYTGIGKYLTPEEFLKIKTVKLPTESLVRVRDLFVFQTYTCLSYSDLKDFDIKSIEHVKGKKVYLGKRNKTGKPFTIPLLPTALDILRKYNDKLPVISNVKYNQYLKAVAQYAGIDKPISSHWARHTGATLLLNEGVNMGIVSKICGHSSIKMTEQVYAKLLDETIVDALDNILI